MWVNFDPGTSELQMVQRNTWAEISLGDTVINVSYFVGVDGISMLLVLADDFHHANFHPGFLRQSHL